jgi:hypothetical protein
MILERVEETIETGPWWMLTQVVHLASLWKPDWHMTAVTVCV